MVSEADVVVIRSGGLGASTAFYLTQRASKNVALHIVGPAPAAQGFFFASGCNVAGLSISPAIGEALAAWIVEGRPPLDLTPLSVARFGSESWSEEQLKKEAAWQYRHFYGAV